MTCFRQASGSKDTFLLTSLAGESKLNGVSPSPAEGIYNEVALAALRYVFRYFLGGHREPALYNKQSMRSLHCNPTVPVPLYCPIVTVPLPCYSQVSSQYHFIFRTAVCNTLKSHVLQFKWGMMVLILTVKYTLAACYRV